MDTACIIVDVQNDYFPNGKMELFNSPSTALTIKKVLDFSRSSGFEVIYIKHIASSPTAAFFLPNTDGIEIYDKIAPLENEKIIIKHYPNSFRDTELDAYLQQKRISNVIIAGMMTHMCIDTTVRAAKDKGYNVTLLEDCCTTKDLIFKNKSIKAEDVHTAYMAALNTSFAKVLSSEEFIAG